jgi:ribose 5-phosphate isomerase B
MKIYLGSDHNGYHLKDALSKYLKNEGYDVIDDGDSALDPSDDFPVYAARVVNDLLASDGHESRGILICGSGQGMCITANRYKGIRACLTWDVESARNSRNDVLCIPARVLAKDAAFRIVDTWLKTEFAQAPRFIRRLREIDELN